MHSTCWEIATLFEPQLTEPGQVDGLLVDVDGTGEPKTAQALALGFKLGVADLAFPLARSLQLAALKEAGEGVIQVTQGFLRSEVLRAYLLRRCTGVFITSLMMSNFRSRKTVALE